MNLKVRIDERIFKVQIGNINARPILVDVEGDLFEVWPEVDIDHNAAPVVIENSKLTHATQEHEATTIGLQPHTIKSKPSNTEALISLRSKSIRAPIPGVITSVYIRPGSEIVVGDELLKLEAMKMNNSIRSNRSGIVSAVHVTVGQVVKLNEVLLEFSG